MEFVLFYITTCKSFGKITFSMYIFFRLFPRIWNQRFFDTHVLKKKLKKSWGRGEHRSIFGKSRMQISKKWLNQSKNFFNKDFKEYYLASFCSWIPSRCENHCSLTCREGLKKKYCSLSITHVSVVDGTVHPQNFQLQNVQLQNIQLPNAQLLDVW